MDAGVSSKAPVPVRTFDAELRAITGSEHVRAATKDDTVVGMQSQLVVEPASEQQVAKILKLANDAGLAVIPRGGGSKLGWGNPPKRSDLVLSTARLDKIIEHAWSDMTVTVEAGCTIAKLQESLAKHGQRLAIDPLWADQATVGGILSTNDSGALRLRFGGLRDLIIGITLALPDGTLASSGGKVVKNVAGYDLPKLATGAVGTLGVITRAVFRLHPLPHNARTLTISVRDSGEVERIMLAIQSSKLAHTALQARIGGNAEAHMDILFEGTEAGLAAQQEYLARLVAPLAANEASPTVWNARQELFSSEASARQIAVVKVSILPRTTAATLETTARIAERQNIHCRLVIQATGIGCIQLDGAQEELHGALQSLRDELRKSEGSLTLLQRPAGMPPFDAWNDPGDAMPLMRAVKEQFDPRTTLNPGRFVGGI